MDATLTNSIVQLLKLNTTLKTHNISLSVFLFVACIENEELNLNVISDKLELSSAAMTTIRDTAFDRGFIKELVAEDRRKKIYQITDKGIEMLASCRQ